MACFQLMHPENEHITISSRNISKNTLEISLSHRHVVDLFGEIRTDFTRNKGASVYATIYAQGEVMFRESIPVGWTNYKISGVPYKIAVTDVQNALVAKVKMIMQEVALTREVVHDEQESFTKMLENTSKAFPALSRKQAMQLVLDALKAKQKRQLPTMDDDAGLTADQNPDPLQAEEEQDCQSLEEEMQKSQSHLLCASLGTDPFSLGEKQEDIGGDDCRAAEINP
jgi:hypothetical protein